jgi:membrane-bound ClpP family serine protease
LRDIPQRVYIRYLVLMIPGVVVLALVLVLAQHWVPIPGWLFGTIVLLWILKEVIMFPFVWRAHDHWQAEPSRLMIGDRGVARERLAPDGYILVRGELWKAEKTDSGPPIEKGEFVRIEKMEGLKLFVRREVRQQQGIE